MATSQLWAQVARRIDRHEWLIPLALFLVSVATYVLLAAGRHGPIVNNDEFIYGNVAQSLGAGDGYTWRALGEGQRTIYPYVIAPAWIFWDGAAAYGVAKAINAVMLSAVVWPVWWLGRELLGPRLAALPAALLLVGMWMESSARL